MNQAASADQANSAAPDSVNFRNVQGEPAVGDGRAKARLEFRWRPFESVQERLVDLLDMTPTVLHRLDGIGQF